MTGDICPMESLRPSRSISILLMAVRRSRGSICQRLCPRLRIAHCKPPPVLHLRLSPVWYRKSGVAWFLIAYCVGRDVTSYGDGKQVRDIVFIDDLVDAYLAAIDKIEDVRGRRRRVSSSLFWSGVTARGVAVANFAALVVGWFVARSGGLAFTPVGRLETATALTIQLSFSEVVFSTLLSRLMER
jgi:hypothetical protein